MRVITWNCNMAFRKKADSILRLNPDLLIVPECEHPNRQVFKNVTSEPKMRLWIGDSETKGLGVFSYSDFEITVHSSYEKRFRYVLPIKVTGTFDFNLLAVWAMNDKFEPRNRYIGQVWLAINYYQSLLEERTVIIGDFNSNVIWDNNLPAVVGNHTDVVEYLKERNIYSTYHYYFAEEQGKETIKTLYLYRRKNRPYHIDYCFVSQELLAKLREVEVGEFDDWISLSDHVPLIVDFNI